MPQSSLLRHLNTPRTQLSGPEPVTASEKLSLLAWCEPAPRSRLSASSCPPLSSRPGFPGGFGQADRHAFRYIGVSDRPSKDPLGLNGSPATCHSRRLPSHQGSNGEPCGAVPRAGDICRGLLKYNTTHCYVRYVHVYEYKLRYRAGRNGETRGTQHYHRL